MITALADPLYQRVIARSLLIAGLVTLATVVTAYPVAYTIAFYGGRYKALEPRPSMLAPKACPEGLRLHITPDLR